MKKNAIILTFISLTQLLLTPTANTQIIDYKQLYTDAKYNEALTAISKRLDDIYMENIELVKIPNEFIILKDQSNEIDLRILFKNRKVSGFFIRDDKELSDLHLYAAKCYYQNGKYRDSLNNYIQSLRYKELEYRKDDVIFYEIAQVFKKQNRFSGYINSLQSAYMLNPDNANYSLEIGLALFNTNQQSVSIHHLEQYIRTADENIDPEIYLKLANLYESLHKYIFTEKYYIEYLKSKPDDGFIHFALGVLSFRKTGNYDLSSNSLNQSIQLLPEKAISQRSLAYEIIGDINYHQHNYENAITAYTNTIQFQDLITNKMNTMQKEIQGLAENINRTKKTLIKDKIYDQYEEYEYLLEQKGKKELQLNELMNQFSRLNAGSIRWKIANVYEQIERYTDAIQYYRQSITYNYKTNLAREKIIKLKLKIKRGY